MTKCAAGIFLNSRRKTCKHPHHIPTAAHESRASGWPCVVLPCWTEVTAGLFAQTAASVGSESAHGHLLFQDQQLCTLRTLPVCVCVCVCVCRVVLIFPTMPLLCVGLRLEGGNTPQLHVETQILTSRHTEQNLRHSDVSLWYYIFL